MSIESPHGFESPHGLRIARRQLLLGAGALPLALGASTNTARAQGRIVPGGRISMRLPWSLGTVDPHRRDDMAAALFAPCLFDSLYARDESGAFIPALAEDVPTVVTATPASADVHGRSAGLLVKLRTGLRTAKNRALTPEDIVFSLQRARALDADTWLVDVGIPRIVRGALVFSGNDPQLLMRKLAAPIAAIVPRGFNPESPDGTGAFRMQRIGDGWALLRNSNAAMGASYLDSVQLREAPDLAASLRAFESSQDDIGYLGLGLHEPRPRAQAFDAGVVGLALLRVGREAQAWDAPGVAQAASDGIPHAALAHLGLGPVTGSQVGAAALKYPADKGQLLVREDAPWMHELAKTVAAALSRIPDAIAVKLVPRDEWRERCRSRNYALAVDVTRLYANTPNGIYATLAAADDRVTAQRLVARPPRLSDPVSSRTVTRLMRIGVLGELHFQGGKVPDLVVPQLAYGGPDFGVAYRGRAPGGS